MAGSQSEFVNGLSRLGINVSRETLQRLETYAALLAKWQAKINLIGPATLPDLWTRHFLDSAQVLPLLDGLLPPLWGKVGMGGDAAPNPAKGGAERPDTPHPAPAKPASFAKPTQPSPARGEGEQGLGGGGTLVDLGSGAGFPGLVLAICRPGLRVHLIDSDQRKCAFLRQVALDTGIKVEIHTKRIAEVTGIAADVVTARACAPLTELLDLAAPFLGHDGGEKGTCLFLKGAQAEDELTQAKLRWMMRLDRRASVTEPSGSILIIGDLKRKG